MKRALFMMAARIGSCFGGGIEQAEPVNESGDRFDGWLDI